MPISATASAESNVPHVRERCAFVLHGLNTNPSRMNDLAELTRQAGFKATAGVLTGHAPIIEPEREKNITAELWKKEFLTQWNAAVSTCRAKKDERLFVGYSLGALTGLNVFDTSRDAILPTKMILISPALALRKKTVLIRLLSRIPFGSIPSLNHPDYRARDNTPLRNYRALFDLHDEWTEFAMTHTGAVGTFVVLSPDDELVDSQSAEKIVKEKDLKQWTIHRLNNSASQLKPKYHHLIIDRRSQGQQEWERFSSEATKFLSQDKLP